MARPLDGIDGADLAAMNVKFTDMHDFQIDVKLEDALVLNQVEKRAREQGRVWWSYEANRGANWFVIDDASQQSGGGGSGDHHHHHHHTHMSRSGSGLLRSLSPLLPPQPSGNLGLGPFSSSSSSSQSSSSSSSAGGAMGNLLLPGGSTATVLKRLIRKGIPSHLRPRVWKAVSGAMRKQAMAPDIYYSSLVEEAEGLETDATRQIDHDLHRTFPGHPKLDTPEGLATLRRILVAYSLRDKHVGYCQGMNYVCAYLLLVMKEEEEAFWMLATLVENVLYDDCFAEDLFGCHVEQRVLRDILARKQPKLTAHLDEIGFELSLVTTEWFLCIFAKSFPSETTLRVWDVLLHEGAKVLFRVALALFKINETALLGSQHIGEAVGILAKSAAEQYDPDVLLQVAFDKLGSMSMSTILKQRRKQKPAVAAALELRQAQITAYIDSQPPRRTLPTSSSLTTMSNPSSANSSPRAIQERSGDSTVKEPKGRLREHGEEGAPRPAAPTLASAAPKSSAIKSLSAGLIERTTSM